MWRSPAPGGNSGWGKPRVSTAAPVSRSRRVSNIGPTLRTRWGASFATTTMSAA